MGFRALCRCAGLGVALLAVPWVRGAENGDAVVIDPEALAEFYGCKVISNRAVFVLDTSMSMKGDKIKELKHNMAGTLGQLPEHTRRPAELRDGEARVQPPQLQRRRAELPPSAHEEQPHTSGSVRQHGRSP